MDILVSFTGLIFVSPIILVFMVLIFLQDFKTPFYIADRVGLNNRKFKMIKLRSMLLNADASGVDSTAADDRRITKIGKVVRKYKLDEITQLFNVLIGNMSLVGPRPNVARETNLYSDQEKHLLTVKPGITDFSSIVFSDEGDILKGSNDPDIDYNQLIRPGKNMLGLFYIRTSSVTLDIKLIFLTAYSILSKEKALLYLIRILENLNAPKELIVLSRRDQPLIPMPPPGYENIIRGR